MAHDLPVVAYAAAAVPETVGDAGLLLESKEPLEFAAAVHRVMEDGALRQLFSRAAARRVEMFSLARSRARFVELVVGAVGA
jgi:glycosyltransferase involved in cell wall biosynthesis